MFFYVDLINNLTNNNLDLLHVDDHEGGNAGREEDEHGDDVDERVPLHLTPVPHHRRRRLAVLTRQV